MSVHDQVRIGTHTRHPGENPTEHAAHGIAVATPIVLFSGLDIVHGC